MGRLPGGGGRGPGGGGPPGGGLGPGGLSSSGGRPPMLDQQASRRYSLNFTAMGRNIFNNVNLAPPVGVLRVAPVWEVECPGRRVLFIALVQSKHRSSGVFQFLTRMRLCFLDSHLNVGGSEIDGWKLKLASATAAVE